MANERKTREIKMSSYQSQICKRILEFLMSYEDNEGVKIFEQFKGHIFYNMKQSIPKAYFPALFIYVDGGSREPFGIKRQDWWVLDVKVMIYTKDETENDMDDHYKWVEGIDRVCRTNPRLHIDGSADLSVHKADLENWTFDFAHGDEFLISETDATIGIRTKMCLANQVS